MSRPSRLFSAWHSLAAVLLLLGGVIGWFVYAEYLNIGEREKERLQDEARVANDSLVRQVDAINRTLTVVRDEVADWQVAGIGNQNLKAFANAMPYVRTLLVMDAYGKVLLSSRPELLGDSYAHRSYFKTVRERPDVNTLYVGEPFTAVSGVYTITLLRVMTNAAGEFDGVVVASLNPAAFRLMLDSMRYAEDSWAALAHGDGRLILSSPERPGLRGADLARPGSLFTRHMQSGHTATVMTDRLMLTGETRIMAQYTLAPPALHMDKPLVIALSRDVGAVYALWGRETRTIGALYALMVLGAPMALYLVRRRQHRDEARAERDRQALHEKSVEVENFFLTAQDMLGIVDFNGRLLKVNAAWTRTLGYSAEELEGMVMLDLVHPDDVRQTLEMGQRLVAGEMIKGHVNRYRSKDGRYRNLEWHIVPIPERGHLHATARDITVQLEMNQVLEEREQFLQSMINVVPGMVGYWDTQLRNVYANKAYQEWFGRTPAQMKGLSARDMMGDTLYRLNEPHLQAALAGEARHFERTLVKADGSTGYTWAHYIPDIVNGQLRGIFAVVSDVTALKRAQIDLEKANAALIQRTAEAEQANIAKSQFLATMSHEIRTPMNGILGMAQLLQMSAPDDPLRHEAVEAILLSGQTLLSLLNDILDLSKIEAGKLELHPADFEPRELVDETVAIFRELATSKGLRLDAAWQGERRACYRGDALRIRQILSNLVSNAIKFTPAGFVYLEAAEVARTADGCELMFSVTDSGIGIAPEDRLRLFKPFSQVDASSTRRFSGTGLGLSIVRRLAVAMGGEVGVESEPGRGSRFWCRIRVEAVRSAPAAAVETATPRPGMPTPQELKGRRVLVAEDLPVNRQVIDALLKKLGMEPVCVNDGAAAVEAVRNGLDTDLILMDIQMPVMDGLDATRRIRQWEQAQNTRRQPIVALTAGAYDEDRQRCMAAGMDDLIIKPLSLTVLGNVLKRWLAPAAR